MSNPTSPESNATRIWSVRFFISDYPHELVLVTFARTVEAARKRLIAHEQAVIANLLTRPDKDDPGVMYCRTLYEQTISFLQTCELVDNGNVYTDEFLN